jgi:hypothetical protein
MHFIVRLSLCVSLCHLFCGRNLNPRIEGLQGREQDF